MGFLGLKKADMMILAGIAAILALVWFFFLRTRAEGYTNIDNFSGLVFFVSPTCVHCTNLKPTITKLETNYPNDVKVIDCGERTEEVKQQMQDFGVNSFPTIVRVVDGKKTMVVEDRDYQSLESALQ
jgi:thiol-disulfide isomerase/thioredoxin